MIHRELALAAESTFDAPTRASPVEGAVGSLVGGKYRVERLLGQGGMGVVVAARHLQLDQLVALKLLNEAAGRDPDGVGRFLREGRLASRLRSEHVARVLDVGTLRSGSPYLVLEYLEGRDLGAELAARGALPVTEAIDLVLQALEAVAEAHALGIVHRDLKPSNLLLTRRPDGSALVKVLDFGLSKNMTAEVGQPALTQSTTGALGSPLYMAPEQVRSALAASPASDQWSIGVTLFELLTDDAPFVGESVGAILAAIVADPPRPLRRVRPSVPAALEAVVSRCLEKTPGHRFPDVGGLAAALAPFASAAGRASAERIGATLGSGSAREGAKGPVAATSRDEHPTRRAAPRSRRRVAAIGGLALLALAASASVLALRSRTVDQAAPARPVPEAASAEVASAEAASPGLEPAEPVPQVPASPVEPAVSPSSVAGAPAATPRGAPPPRRPPAPRATAVPSPPPAPGPSTASPRSVEDLVGKGRL